ncbi:MAG TPA: alkaline phosphatase family protein [Steroidobacteraceae bacterium]|nr:alkaline phosphatase family protein [Steroidobacteraceae bacterium]
MRYAHLTAALLAVSALAHAGPPNPLAPVGTLRCTADPKAASTVPGWSIVSGSPALRCGSAFPAMWPARSAPRVVIASGPYGTSVLERLLPLQAVASQHRRFTLSASFGAFGQGSERAALTGEFLGASGQRLGAAVVLRGPPAVGRKLPVRFAPHSVAGNIPPGAVEMDLRLELGGRTGVAMSYVAAMRLETAPLMSFPPPAPPPARVPRFDHVFLIMMENTDYGQVAGDTKNAPFINSLAARGTLLANYQAVYHPSDQNYLAIAGGDTFVRDGAYFPKIHVAAQNLGDLLEAAGETWKTYLEGMGTPCNVTTRYDKNFEPDDAPFINFSDIQSNPGRCRAHLVDLSAWFGDLKRAADTPAFAWLAADDYDDGELPGNGSPKSLRVQDAWLQRTLDPLFTSPAWREQRCLLILTWDESSTTLNNHIATIVVGSRRTVKSAYVSLRRYDNYSTARTIEAALGLPSMTSNDAYAPTLDDAFVRN